MRFQRSRRCEFTDTPRKRAAFFSKQRRERETLPLFAAQIAEEQAQRPSVDEVMIQRAIGFAKGEKESRDRRAAEWRKARKRLSAYGDNMRAIIRQLWSECPYPGDPSYLMTFLHSIDVGRIDIDNPPWRYSPSELATARATLEAYLARGRASSQTQNQGAEA